MTMTIIDRSPWEGVYIGVEPITTWFKDALQIKVDL